MATAPENSNYLADLMSAVQRLNDLHASGAITLDERNEEVLHAERTMRPAEYQS